MTELLGVLIGALGKLLLDWLADLRRESTLRELGRTQATADQQKERADAEERMRRANAEPAGDDAERLRRGQF